MVAVPFAQWIFCDPLWPSTVSATASQLWTSQGSWLEKLGLIERIIHDAASEIRELRRCVCKKNHRQVLALCLRAIRCLETGQHSEMIRLCKLAPHLRIGHNSGEAHIRKVLSEESRKARDKQLEEAARESENAAGASTTSSALPSRSSWACRMWRAWRQMKIMPEVGVLASSGQLCNCRDEEVEALTGHWQKLFQNSHCLPSDAEWLLAYVPHVDWALEIGEEELIQVITHAPNTAVGPDCIPYRAYKPIATIVASALCGVISACSQHITLPTSWKEAVTVFIPKR
eukprot:6458461-Amphidinium_carterae.1